MEAILSGAHGPSDVRGDIAAYRGLIETIGESLGRDAATITLVYGSMELLCV